MVVNGSVAIVDDEAELVRTYELLFKNRNIPLSFTALDGPEAFEKFEKANPRPGVVIIDHRLPSMSGIDLMRDVLALEPNAKIIFISGDHSVREESIEAGANVFLGKPTSIKVITDTVTRLMSY
jgi:two-component system, chemotaxis family, chemotaxis protein CheY